MEVIYAPVMMMMMAMMARERVVVEGEGVIGRQVRRQARGMYIYNT